MSNLFRRASDAIHHHQRKSSEDSVNQETLVNPAQEPQEPVEPQIPAASQPEPQESKVDAASGENKDQAGKHFPMVTVTVQEPYTNAVMVDPESKPAHHRNWGWHRRPSQDEREKR
ncbi:hypothetical protein F1880_002558 [Penicillium rolfsii]|nr:hypothetical protein F1880_002558 [Penicillium rolfsii]